MEVGYNMLYLYFFVVMSLFSAISLNIDEKYLNLLIFFMK
jgi:hypothetical protein